MSISYSININTSSPLKRPLTCYITTDSNELNAHHVKASSSVERQTTSLFQASLKNHHRSCIHLPITYSTSIHLPCSSKVSTSSHHHFHHYYHHYHHHHHHYYENSTSTNNLQLSSFQPSSVGSTRADTEKTRTTTSPESTTTISRNSRYNLDSSPIQSKTPSPPKRIRSSPPIPAYSSHLWNLFHHVSKKSPTNQKGSQSDYSEVCRKPLSTKPNPILKLFKWSMEKNPTENSQAIRSNQKRVKTVIEKEKHGYSKTNQNR